MSIWKPGWPIESTQNPAAGGTRREKSLAVHSLVGRNRLPLLLKAVSLARSTSYYDISHPAHVTRPYLEPLVRKVWDRSPNGCGYRQILMALKHEFKEHVSGKSVLAVMRWLGLCCLIRSYNPWKKYSSFRGVFCAPVPNLLQRNFKTARPFEKLGTNVTEFKVAGGKAYLAPIYNMRTKEIICWNVSQHPNFKQQEKLLARLKRRLLKNAHPVLHSDMG